jgi:GAF domain-containing protein
MPDADDLTESVGAVRAAVLAELRARTDHAVPLRLVCQACVRLLPIDGASASMMTGTAERTMLYASDDVVAHIEALQFSLGEGPCVEAFETRRPVLVPDLAAAPAQSWPVFAEEMIGQPVNAIFAFPLQSGAISLGAMDLYRHRTGWFSQEELAIALALVDVAAMALLSLQLGEPPEGGIGAEQWGMYGDRAVVHQASGMLIAALGLSPEQALSRLRGYAFATGRMVDAVARDIVARDLSPTELDR